MGNFLTDTWDKVQEPIESAYHETLGPVVGAFRHRVLSNVDEMQHQAHTAGLPTKDPIGYRDPANATARAAAAGPAGGGGGGAGINKRTGMPKGVYSLIKQEAGDPNMSVEDARKLFHHFNAKTKYPGLSQFVKDHSSDPLAVQNLYSQAIAPFLQQTADTYNTSANAGYQAMQKILSSSSMPSAERAVLQANAPIQHANDMKVGALLGATTAQKPMVDSVLQKLQSMIDEQQQARYFQNQIIAQGQQGGTTGGVDPAIAQLIAGSLK